jgi:hypothetical protein
MGKEIENEEQRARLVRKLCIRACISTDIAVESGEYNRFQGAASTASMCAGEVGGDRCVAVQRIADRCFLNDGEAFEGKYPKSVGINALQAANA